MKSPSYTHLLPTGGFSRWRCSSIQACRLKGGVSISVSLGQYGQALQLDRDRRRERGDAEGRAAGRARRVREILRPDRVVGLEITRHVGEVDGDVDEVLPARAAGIQHRAHVGEHRMAL